MQKQYSIYLLYCHTTKKKYVGSTGDLKARIAVHESSCKHGRSCSSSEVVRGRSFAVLVLEENIPEDQRYAREHHYITAFRDSGGLVNKNLPILCKSSYSREYYLRNKQKIKERSREFYKKRKTAS